jgi:hypothetical protein
MNLYTVILSYLGELRVKQVMAPSHFEVPPSWICDLQIDDVLGLPEGFVEEVSAEISNSKVKPVNGALNAWQQSLSLEDGTALLTIVQTIEKGSKRSSSQA